MASANKKTLKMYTDCLDMFKTFSEMYGVEPEQKTYKNVPTLTRWVINWSYKRFVDVGLYPDEYFCRCGDWSLEMEYNLITGEIHMYVSGRTASYLPIYINIDKKSYSNYEMIDNIVSGVRVFMQNEVNRLINDRQVILEDKKKELQNV